MGLFDFFRKDDRPPEEKLKDKINSPLTICVTTVFDISRTQQDPTIQEFFNRIYMNLREIDHDIHHLAPITRNVDTILNQINEDTRKEKQFKKFMKNYEKIKKELEKNPIPEVPLQTDELHSINT